MPIPAATPTMPQFERGYLHLTPRGWIRADFAPYPDDRIETWQYESEVPSPMAKTQVRLTRVWLSQATTPKTRRELHNQFGDPVAPDRDHNILMECRV